MRLNHLQYLACPVCRSDLRLGGDAEAVMGRIRRGSLECAKCHRQFGIREFVPRFVSDDNYAAAFALQWSRHARTQLDSYTGVPLSENRFFGATRWPRRLDGDLMLEVGSGAGRFTEVAARTGAMIVSVEYSAAVDANYANNGSNPNVLLVQADMHRMPLRGSSFDRIFCFGVLQHTPDVQRAFLELPQYLKSGGRLAIDVYRKPQGWGRITTTKYWVRPLTRRMPQELLYGLTRAYVDLMWPVTRLIDRVPKLGRIVSWALLVADYRGVYDLPDDLLREWAQLDTFDMLSPRYDSPQTLRTVRDWFEKAGLVETEVRFGYNGIVGGGVRP